MFSFSPGVLAWDRFQLLTDERERERVNHFEERAKILKILDLSDFHLRRNTYVSLVMSKYLPKKVKSFSFVFIPNS